MSSTSTPSTSPHLGDQQVDDGLVGQVDDQFVDGSTGAPLDDVDADDVASHRADPGRDGTQRTRTVGQPDAEYDGSARPRDPTEDRRGRWVRRVTAR